MFETTISYTVKVGKRKASALIPRLKAWQNQTTVLLGKIPGPVHYPVRWTSERQRRAFFATKGFGRGIPTKRTGDVARWDVLVDYATLEKIGSFLYRVQVVLAHLDPRKKQALGSAPPGGVIISIANAVPYQRYVTGSQQQGFHQDTGWIYAPSIIATQIHRLDGLFEDTGFR
jgi:hypothetical protein